jgi:chromosome segregation ATPase
VFKRRADIEHAIRDTDHENANLQAQVAALQGDIEGLQAKLGGDEELIEELEKAISNAEKTLKAQQAQVAELTSSFDRQKYELAYLVKALDGEQAKTAMLNEKLMHGENLLRHLDSQLAQLEDTGNLDDEIDRLTRQNGQLENQLAGCKAHVENLFNQNNQLMTNLEMMAEDDEKVRTILERKPMALRARERFELHSANARRSIDNNQCQRLHSGHC